MQQHERGLLAAVSLFTALACGGSEFQATGKELSSRDGDAATSASGGISGGSGGSTPGGSGGRVQQASGGTTASGGGSENAGGALGQGGASGGGAPGTGSTPSSGGSDGDAGANGGAGGAGAGGGSVGSGGGVVAVDAGQGCDDPPTWYPDDDQDNYGRSTGSVVWCTPPPTGNWSPRGGDCNDDDERVHPGQAEYFDQPYSTPAGGSSFDYDCSGTEDASPESPVLPTCSAFNLLLQCRGEGYAKTGRTGAGVNGYCGSFDLRACAWTGLLCQAQAHNRPTVGFRCR